MKKTHVVVIVALLSACLATVASADTAKGQGVYMNFCAACHDSGIAGAPKTGDKEDWTNRVSKGTAAVIENAIKGYQGNNGYMPAKGGNSALTDEEVSFAVIYMLEMSK